MKISKIPILIATVALLVSCGGGGNNAPHTAAGFTTIENELKNKFGQDAHYTSIHISHDENIGNMVALTVAEDPESMKMEEWTFAQNSWNQTSDVTIEVSEGTKAADYMFQLDDTINLTKLGGFIEQSSTKLSEEKDIENPALYTALVKFPRNGDISDMEYSITMKPENGGTSFYFDYALDGTLIKMDY